MERSGTVTVSVKESLPTVKDEGLSPLIEGTGFGGCETGRGTSFDVPPPGNGLKTVIASAPPVEMSAAVTVAVS